VSTPALAISPAIALSDVEVRAGRQPILGPVDLTVTPGEHVLIVGPSGCGKTTLLRTIAGLARPRMGRVALFGELASHGPRLLLTPARRRLGFLFQNGALWPHMSVRKTLDFVMRQAGLPRAERKLRGAELIDLVELTGLERRKPATLSGGEAQRLALARALAVGARIMLLDEPLGPLDAELRQGLLERLQRLQAEFELTILHVTHDPEEARAVSGRTLHMAGGQLVSEELHG